MSIRYMFDKNHLTLKKLNQFDFKANEILQENIIITQNDIQFNHDNLTIVYLIMCIEINQSIQSFKILQNNNEWPLYIQLPLDKNSKICFYSLSTDVDRDVLILHMWEWLKR